MPNRKERADSFIQQELTVILRDKVHDPRVDSLTITEVSLTKDRRVARVYVASFEDEETLKEGFAGPGERQGPHAPRTGATAALALDARVHVQG